MGESLKQRTAYSSFPRDWSTAASESVYRHGRANVRRIGARNIGIHAARTIVHVDVYKTRNIPVLLHPPRQFRNGWHGYSSVIYHPHFQQEGIRHRTSSLFQRRTGEWLGLRFFWGFPKFLRKQDVFSKLCFRKNSAKQKKPHGCGFSSGPQKNCRLSR
jgi:hypothetical protein